MSNIKLPVKRLKEIISEEVDRFNNQKQIKREEFLEELRTLDSDEALEYLQEVVTNLTDDQIDLLLEGANE
jgi:hypothetical protein